MPGLWDIIRRRRQVSPHHQSLNRTQTLRRAAYATLSAQWRGASMEPMEPRLLLAADDLVISEFMADNRTTLVDRYGEYSDWIEVYNPGTSPVNLEGWYLTDSASDLTRWRFPALELRSGGYLVVFASGKDQRSAGQELHTNFKLSSDGEYLALIKPDGHTITSQYAPRYPRQVPGVSYGLVYEPVTPGLIPTGAHGRAIIPAGDMGADWTLPSFDDSAWPYQGPTGFGFDANDLAQDGYFNIFEAYSPAPLRNLNDAYTFLYGGGGDTTYTYTAPYINLADPQARDGRFRDNMAFKGDTPAKDANYVVRISGVIHIPTTGVWTFGVNSADGFLLTIDGASFTSSTGSNTYVFGNVMEVYETRNAGDSLGVARISAGEHRVELVYFQGTTGGEVEFFAAPGSKSSFDTTFKLVGDSAHGGLDVVGLQDLVGTDLQAGMHTVNASAYVRIPFPAIDPATLDRLVLRMKYDDGFVAYLNGHEIVRSDNVPSSPTWNSAADSPGSDIDALLFEDFDISRLKQYLSATGPNVLAIQVLNASASDPDLLALPELVGTLRVSPDEARYFMTPTPGRSNSIGVEDLGPVISNVTHSPQMPNDANSVFVTARVEEALTSVGSVQLRYRVNYGPEVPVTMYDDGQHDDGKAGDHVFGAAIPPSAAKPGEMVRYYVIADDTGGRQSRWPIVPTVDPEPWSNRKWPEYQGFVIAAATLPSTLPTLYWFTSNYAAADTRAGTRASVWYNGEFFDNVFIRHRGGNSTSGNKIQFNRGYYFQFASDLERVSEINLNSQGYDESWIRPILMFETFRDAGVPSSIAAPVRVQRGSGSADIRLYIEQPDDEFLERQGLYGDGALYKAQNYNNPTMEPWGFDKENRDNEWYDDIQTFINGLRQSDRNARIRFIYDNVDIPQFLNYQAAIILTEQMDAVMKNYYLYRDTQDANNPTGTNQWRMLPWDGDLTFGKNWGITDYQARDPYAHPFLGDRRHPKNDSSSSWNLMIDALLDVPEIKQMYLRRLRTLMDQLLQPLSTPYADRYYETRIDELYTLLIGDPKLKSSAATLKRYFDDIKTKYLNVRRQHLYIDHSENTKYRDYAGIPGAQVGSPTITFGDVEFNPLSGNQDQEFIELRNPNAFAVDISGWKIEGAIDYKIPPGVVIPANGMLYLSPNLVAFRNRASGPRGNQGLLVVGPYKGQLSARGETLVLTDGAGNLISEKTIVGSPTPAQQFLRVSEIMYNPPDAAGANRPDNDEFEFIELQNTSSTQSLDLKGIRFTSGIDFTFGELTLMPGQYTLVVKNRSAFESRYGTGLPIAGEYPAKYLDNKSDRIQLVDAAGENILDFSYEDSWHQSTDGGGRSLVVLDPSAPSSSWDHADNWRPSARGNGSPGLADPDSSEGLPTVRIVPVQPERRYTPVDSITIIFSEPVSGFDLTDLSFTRDDNAVPLGSSQSLSTTDNIRWVLTGLADLTNSAGNYRLAIGAYGVIDASRNPLMTGDSEKFTISTLPLTAEIAPISPDPRNAAAGPFTITFNRPVEHFGLSDLRLTRDGSSNLLTGFERLVTTDHQTWKLYGVSALTAASGTYAFSLTPATSNITDELGYALMSGDEQTFTVDVTPPSVAITLSAPDPQTGLIDRATFAFSESISGFDPSDLQLLRDGIQIPLSPQTTLAHTDSITWTLHNLSISLDRPGQYQLLVKAAGSYIVDLTGNPLASNATAELASNVIRGDASLPNQNITLIGLPTEPPTLDVFIGDVTTPAYTLNTANLQQILVLGGSGADTLTLKGSLALPIRFRGGEGADTINLDLSGGTYAFHQDLATDTPGLTLNIHNSKVTFQASQHLAALNLSGGAKVTLAAGIDKTLLTDSLSIDDQSTLDVADNSLVVRSTSANRQQVLDRITTWIKAARATDGNGLASSTAQANKQTGLAAILNDDGKGAALFSRFADDPVTVNDILVKYTWNGDVNLDGIVDAADYFLVDSGYITQQGGYRHGDLNLDGAVDAADYFLIDSAFIAQGGMPSAKKTSPLQQLFSTKPLLELC